MVSFSTTSLKDWSQRHHFAAVPDFLKGASSEGAAGNPSVMSWLLGSSPWYYSTYIGIGNHEENLSEVQQFGATDLLITSNSASAFHQTSG